MQYLTPSARCISSLQIDELSDLEIPTPCAQSLIALAIALIMGKLHCTGGKDLKIAIEQLHSLSGIDLPTAQYIAMRVPRWTDVFPKEDWEMRNASGCAREGQAENISRKWRPWRSCATFHLCL